MGLFRRTRIEMVPVATRLDETWFAQWLDEIFTRTGEVKTERATLDYLDKLSAVADRFCGRAVQQNCSVDAGQAFERFAAGAGSPWEIVGVAYGLAGGATWGERMVDECEAQMRRFADIIVDPSIVE